MRQFLLPACERKVLIADEMMRQSDDFPVSSVPDKGKGAFDLSKRFVEVMRGKALLQLTCVRDWLETPHVEVTERMLSLDRAEDEAMMAGIRALNQLIAIAHLGRDEWLGICTEAFNDVRVGIGLQPLSSLDFRSRFLQGIAGGRPRFFED